MWNFFFKFYFNGNKSHIGRPSELFPGVPSGDGSEKIVFVKCRIVFGVEQECGVIGRPPQIEWLE